MGEANREEMMGILATASLPGKRVLGLPVSAEQECGRSYTVQACEPRTA